MCQALVETSENVVAPVVVAPTRAPTKHKDTQTSDAPRRAAEQAATDVQNANAEIQALKDSLAKAREAEKQAKARLRTMEAEAKTSSSSREQQQQQSAAAAAAGKNEACSAATALAELQRRVKVPTLDHPPIAMETGPVVLWVRRTALKGDQSASRYC